MAYDLHGAPWEQHPSLWEETDDYWIALETERDAWYAYIDNNDGPDDPPLLNRVADFLRPPCPTTSSA